MSEKLTVILPIETISRELDGRLLLSALFGKKHHRIFLAHSSLANRIVSRLKSGGLYIGKHIMAPTAKDPSVYFKAKENKFTVVQSAEEGAVFMGQPKDWSLDLDFQLDPTVLSKEDYVATWGKWQRGYYLQKGAPNPDHVCVTGHPRFELCKSNYAGIYAKEAGLLREKFGRYVLLNANFSCVTHNLGLSQVFSSGLYYHPEDPELRHRFVEQWAYQMQVVQEFVRLVHRFVDKFPEISMIVRPHPDDSLDFFKNVFKGLRNVHILREGTVFPWILGSELLIHDGCTTAIEAFLAEKPVMSFTPVRSDREIFLPNCVGERVFSQDEALFKIAKHLKEPARSTNPLPDLAYDLFFNLKHDSMEFFLEVLLEADENSPRSHLSIMDILLEEKKALFIENTKKIVRPLFRERYLAATATKILFPGFNKDYVKKRLSQISKFTGCFMEIKYFGSSLIELNPVL